MIRSTRVSALLTALILAPPALAHGDHGGGGGTILPPGITLISFEYDQVRFRPISDARLVDLSAQERNAHSLREIAVPSISIGYGLTRDLTIGLRAPYLANRGIRETGEDPLAPDIAARGGVYGFGDVSLTATYRLSHDANSGFDTAVIFGVKAPTGRNDAVDKSGVLFETEHQPGTGSWDGLFGATLTKQAGPFTLTGNALFMLSGPGDQLTNQGDRLTYSLSASYRMWTSSLASPSAMRLGGSFDGMMHHGGVDHSAAGHTQVHTPGRVDELALDVSLGLNGFWSGQQQIAGVRDDNTGGNLLLITPGLRLSTDRWAGFVNVGLPVVRDLNGIQSDPKWQLSTGVSVQF
jgi:hypothetical protein